MPPVVWYWTVTGVAEAWLSVTTNVSAVAVKPTFSAAEAIDSVGPGLSLIRVTLKSFAVKPGELAGACQHELAVGGSGHCHVELVRPLVTTSWPPAPKEVSSEPSALYCARPAKRPGALADRARGRDFAAGKHGDIQPGGITEAGKVAGQLAGPVERVSSSPWPV